MLKSGDPPRCFRTGLLALLTISCCYGQRPGAWRFWDAHDGFVESYTNSVAAGPNGQVWVRHGSFGKIELLDGYSGPSYPQPNSNGPLESAPDGSVWIWSGKGLSRLENHQWKAFPVSEVSRQGSLRGNSREAWEFTSYASAFLSASLSVVALDRSHALIMLPDRILEFTAPASLRTVVTLQDTGLRRMTALRRTREGTTYLTGYGGIGRLEGTAGGAWRWQELPRPPSDYVEFDEPISLRPRELFVAGVTRAGTACALRFDGQRWETVYRGESRNVRAWPGVESSVWVQDGNHVLEVSGGRVTVAARMGGLSGALVGGMVEAPGRFWITGSQGLSHYMPSLWRTPEAAPALDDLVNAITEDKAGNLWFLAERRLIRFDNRKWYSYPLPKSETSWSIFTEGFTVLRDGRIAIGTKSPYLLLFDPARHTFQTVRHGQGGITRMTAGQPDGTLLVEVIMPGAENATIERFDGTEFRPFLAAEKLKGINEVRTVLAVAGRVWLGTMNMFQVRDGSGERKIGAPDGFTDPGGYFVFRDAAGHLFAGGRDGFFAERAGKWKVLQTGLDRVRNAIEARDGSLWIASGSGVHRYRNGVWLTQGEEEGLPSSVVYKVFEDSRGRIWAGTTRGLSLFHPEADTEPPVVSLAGDHVPSEAPPDGRFQLGFSGTDKWKATPESRLLYSYRLDGGGWTPFSPIASASFDQLPSGRHQIEVRAMDRNGNISVKPAAHAFAVLPVWYRTPEFVVLALVAAAIIAILLVLATASYIHRGALIRSLNQKSRLERDRQNVLEKIARREPLVEILRQIGCSLGEACPQAIALLVWKGGAGLEVFSFPALPENRRREIAAAEIPEQPNPKWWRTVCAPEHSEASPIMEIQAGDEETLGAIGLLFQENRPVPHDSYWLLETFRGLSVAAIENARLYERLAHQARHDVLTGLPNRLCFEDKLQWCVEAAEASGRPLAVFYVDLDRFKQINDTLGHRVGDHFLREVALRFTDALRSAGLPREDATLARIGGDEFTVLLEHGANQESARSLAGLMHEALRDPIVIEGESLTASASIGISMYPEDGTTPSALQMNADIAMYRAKATAGSRIEFFSGGSPAHEPLGPGLDVLRHALEEKLARMPRGQAPAGFRSSSL